MGIIIIITAMAGIRAGRSIRAARTAALGSEFGDGCVFNLLRNNE
jgi:hypothetical protein